MSRWKELPAEQHPHIRQLIVRLRTLKDRSGLSTQQVAARTGYSAKSWQRYLNGRSLPPREAVEAMARVGGDDPDRLLVLHEMAAEHWAEDRVVRTRVPGDVPPAAPGAPPEGPPPGRTQRVVIGSLAVALALSVSVAVVLAVRLAEARGALADARAGAGGAAPAVVSETMVPVHYTCRLEQRDGRWYAGLSRTTDSLLAYTYVGPAVAEAQCLLRRAGFPPGDIDGIFGPRTQRAVQHIQERHGLVVDGVIGSHTWKALRGAEAP
ncbi:peptidoglycan-binding protein [Streptomyces fungicidicus]|uniref:peptidoglycan-binding protein n=1 Tax=Streptomyces fungicidicus TaxID=68203 RepID=UPI0037A071BA